MGESSAVFPLAPVESKRLIARGVAALPAVRKALTAGRVIIANGTTNAYVVEELLGVEIPRGRYATGVVTQGALCTTPTGEWMAPYIIRKGEVVRDVPLDEILREFEPDDVFLKGANALDPLGTVGILVSGKDGGTIGRALGTVQGRGAHLVAPVGLEKMVASVAAAARAAGSARFRRSYGAAVGLIPIIGAVVVTELTALRILTGVSAVHLASGGAGGSEGAVVIAVRGEERAVEETFRLVRQLKKEPPLALRKQPCSQECRYHCSLIL